MEAVVAVSAITKTPAFRNDSGEIEGAELLSAVNSRKKDLKEQFAVHVSEDGKTVLTGCKDDTAEGSYVLQLKRTVVK